MRLGRYKKEIKPKLKQNKESTQKSLSPFQKFAAKLKNAKITVPSYKTLQQFVKEGKIKKGKK